MNQTPAPLCLVSGSIRVHSRLKKLRGLGCCSPSPTGNSEEPDRKCGAVQEGVFQGRLNEQRWDALPRER